LLAFGILGIEIAHTIKHEATPMGRETTGLGRQKPIQKWRAWRVVGGVAFLMVIAGVPDLLIFHRERVGTIQSETRAI
jgi:hypothetical protein